MRVRGIAAVLTVTTALSGCASSGRYVLASNKTVTVTMHAMVESRVLTLRNASSQPIVVTAVELYDCENVAQTCGIEQPNLDVAPGTSAMIARVAPMRAGVVPRFKYRYRWASKAAPAAAMASIPTGWPTTESPTLAARVTGLVVEEQPAGELLYIRFPGARVESISRPRWQAHFISGPDSAGNIALGTDTANWKTHQIRLRSADGAERVLAHRDGGILWHNAIGPVSLAPVGGRVAFVSKLGETVNNYAPLGVGALEIWDPVAGAIRRLNQRSLGLYPPSWFPDGRRLTYVANDDPPRVHLVNVDSGEDAPFAPGEFSLVSSDGLSVLVRRGPVLLRVDQPTKMERPVFLPGNLAAPVAYIESRYVLYRATPTPGMPSGMTTNNSPSVGPKPLQSLKLLDIETGEFVTLVSLLDPRFAVSASLRVK